MARTRRLRAAGYPLHVTQRGHNHAPCFLDPAEHGLYLGLLAEFAPRHACRIHAYALMTNHVHLLFTPEDEWGSSRLMKDVTQRYVQHFNAKHKRSGSLWSGRFHSSIVESREYFLACQRYIELNPVDAGMVSCPSRYPWSSYGSNALGLPSLLLVPHDEYLALASTDEGRRSAYAAMFKAEFPRALAERIELAQKGSLPLGSDEFVARIEAETGVRTRRRKPGPSPGHPRAVRGG
ncbi:MAG TPA: transposase [Usitatibacter sp.]|nr:transposase [Usitatibacter sp.]